VTRKLVLPSRRLTALERVAIYNVQYWLRLRACLVEDFDGLRRLVGARRYDALADAYLHDCPSRSFTLRDLGARFPDWLARHRSRIGGLAAPAVEMARLEWAAVESFDAAQLPPLTARDLAGLRARSRLRLQPHVRLLQLDYAVDALLLDEAADRPARERVHMVVHRSHNELFFKRVPPADFRVLRALDRGASIAEAALQARTGPEEVSAIFARASRLGWFAKPERR
jgi:hypothetical protein